MVKILLAHLWFRWELPYLTIVLFQICLILSESAFCNQTSALFSESAKLYNAQT